MATIEVIKQLRKMVEEKIKMVPEGKRLYINKELLERLLFEQETRYLTFIKIPMWTGEFLSKIDLSEISFENVNLYSLDDNYIMLKDTNAIIDLNKICNPGLVRRVNLSGTKLIGYLIESYDADLSNCGLSAVNLMKYSRGQSTNFTNNNLDDFIISDERQVFCDDVNKASDFRNTGAVVNKDIFSYPLSLSVSGLISVRESSEFYKKFDGCKIISLSDIKSSDTNQYNGDNPISDELLDSLSLDLDRQISKFR